MQIQQLFTDINVNEIETIDECDELLYQLKDLINKVKYKRSELLLEMIESHEYREVVISKEMIIEPKEYFKILWR